MSAPISVNLPDTAIEEIVALVLARVANRGREAPVSPWLTTSEAASYLRCGCQRIFDLTSQGRLRVHKDGSRNLYRRDDLDEYLQIGRGSR